jgi:tRNA pseudouridine38-40 synthase
MRVLKFTLAYDGTRFVGWQRQADGESIQGLLEQALAKFQGATVTVHGAGRTDAGVHALGQIASASVTFTHPTATIVRALNALLPEDIRILEVADAAPDFHARFSARSKTYRYHIRAGIIGDPFTRAFVWQIAEALDAAAMRDAAASLVGTHDFAAFQSAGTDVASSVRTIFRSELRSSTAERSDDVRDVRTFGSFMTSENSTTERPERSEPTERSERSDRSERLLVYEVTADGFLRHMVRAIVGTLVEIGRGRRPVAWLDDVLASGDRTQAGRTAPAEGLFLVRVEYDAQL